MSLNFAVRILAVAVIGLLSASPSWARVGVASVVDGEPKGMPPGATERVINIGNDMQPNERVTTGANDKAHIVFLDGSSLTVEPNSVLTIDKFVYDPDRKTGELALNASRGVFRFVGGAISKNSEVTVKTPSATMGIRGGIAVFAISTNGNTTAYLLFGASLTVTSQGVTQVTTQPGFQIVVPPGGPPTPPTQIPPNGISFIGIFQNSGGGPGIAAIGAAFANAGFSSINSGLSPAVLLAAIYATQQAQLKTGGGTQFASNNPLQGAAPIQAVGPMPDYGLGLPTPPDFLAGPWLPFGPYFANGGTMNELLEQLLGGPNPPSPQTLATLVNLWTPPTDSPPAPPAGPPPENPPPFPPRPPGQLPPTVYNTPCQSQVSQSNC